MRIDRDAALSQLRQLGYQDGDEVYLRAIPGNGLDGATIKLNQGFPRLPWGRLERLQSEGKGIYIVVNGGGHSDSTVEAGRAIFCEFDDRPIEDQLLFWEAAGLPEPTLQIKTRKSVHTYWTLEDCPIEQWRQLQTDLLNHVDADRSLKNPSRVMRLAGCWHVKAGEEPVLCEIVSEAGECYSYADLRSVIPKAEKPASVSLPTLNYSPEEPIPLEKCLSRTSRSLIESGAPEGNRNSSGAKLARDLLGTAVYLATEGVRYQGDARQLFDYFCTRCNPAIDAKEAEQIWRSAEKDTPSPSLPPDYIDNCIKAWQRKQSSDTPKQKSRAEERPSGEELAEEIPALARLYYLIKSRLGDRIRLNTLTKQIEIDGKQISIDRIRLELAVEYSIQAGSERDALSIITKLAEDNQYSPIVEYLESCYQRYGNDTSILEGFAERYFGQTAEIYQAFVKRTLIAAVARAFQPGCKHDAALILQGKQEAGKSSVFRVLSNGWFDDSFSAIGDKDERLKLHRCWFAEWGELEAVFRRKDIATTKSFLSCQVDLVRPPYAQSIQEMPRHSIIVGSTNLDEFLSDPTGNRRFWVVPVTIPVDLHQLRLERDRIWAAAVALYKSGESWELSPSEKANAAAIAQEYQTTDPWHDLIKDFVVDRDVVTTREILNDLLKIEPGRQEKSQQMRVADVLREMGWQRCFDWHNGKRQRVWRPPDPPVPPCATSKNEVAQAQKQVTEGDSEQPDPPDPPFEPETQKFPDNENTSLSREHSAKFPKNGGSGGSGGSEVYISKHSTVPPSDPPLKNGRSGSDSLYSNGLGNGHHPAPILRSTSLLGDDEWEDI